jgi:Exopolyphosphatase-related proteins
MDGMAAAWVCYKKFGDNAEYIAVLDRYNLPEYILNHPNLKDCEIYIIDFAYSKETHLDLEHKCKKLVVLDHHVSSKEAVISVKNYVYEEFKSGALIAWEYFNQNKETPKAIQYISDNDTWTHTLQNYKEITAFIYKADEDLNFDYIEKIVNYLEDENNFKKAIEIGSILNKIKGQLIKKYIERAELINFENNLVYAVNAPSELKSELGHELAKKTNSFAIIYNYQDSMWKVSFRSVPEVDVSVIAKKYGGGGHKNAAAFVLKSPNPMLKILNLDTKEII